MFSVRSADTAPIAYAVLASPIIKTAASTGLSNGVKSILLSSINATIIRDSPTAAPTPIIFVLLNFSAKFA